MGKNNKPSMLTEWVNFKVTREMKDFTDHSADVLITDITEADGIEAVQISRSVMHRKAIVRGYEELMADNAKG